MFKHHRARTSIPTLTTLCAALLFALAAAFTNAAAQTAFQESSFGFQGRPSGGRRGLGTLFDPGAQVTLTPTTTLTLYGAGVRGGDVQRALYPSGGQNPTARPLYVELTRRF